MVVRGLKKGALGAKGAEHLFYTLARKRVKPDAKAPAQRGPLFR